MYISGILKSSNEFALVNANKIEYVKGFDHWVSADLLIKLDNGEELSVFDHEEKIRLLNLTDKE